MLVRTADWGSTIFLAPKWGLVWVGIFLGVGWVGLGVVQWMDWGQLGCGS